MADRTAVAPRQRLTKEARRAQLLEVARELIRDDGTDRLTLGKIAERAGVTKPLVYEHFGDRHGILAELYHEFETRQRLMLDVALETVSQDLSSLSAVVAGAYIDCCLAEGRELVDVVEALAGSSTLRELRSEAEAAYLSRCREALEPIAGPIDAAELHAIIGAGDSLARSVLAGGISAVRARRALARVVLAVAGDAERPEVAE